MLSPNQSEPLHVIVDGGVDDALALAVLIGDRVPLAQVIATEGSRSLEQTARTTARLVSSLGSSVPVRLGAASGLSGPYPEERDPFHGEDCFGGRSDLLRREADIGEETWLAITGPVLATGALTVVAQALRAGQSVGAITWMGGSVAYGGNMTATAEFNAWMDPVAADEVFRSGHLQRMVPLDVTMRCTWREADIRMLKSRSAAGTLVGCAAEALCLRDGSFVPHDAVAAAAIISPNLFAWVAREVRCETAGLLTTGETVVDRRPWRVSGPTLVAEEVDVDGVRDLILETVGAVPDS